MQKPDRDTPSKRKLWPCLGLLTLVLFLSGNRPTAPVADFIRQTATQLGMQGIQLSYEKLTLRPSTQAQAAPIPVALKPGPSPASPNVDALLEGLKLNIQGIEFQGTAFLQNVFSPLAVVTMKLKSRPFALAKLEKSNPVLAKMIFPGVLQEGKLESMTLQFKAPLRDTHDSDALKRSARANAVFKLTNAGFKVKDKNVRFPVLHGKAVWRHPQWTHELKGKLYQGQLKSKGKTIFAESGKTAAFDATFTLEKLQLAKVDLFKDSDLKFLRGTLSGIMRVHGELPLDAKAKDLGALKGAATLTGKRIFLNAGGAHQQWQEASIKIAESPLFQPKGNIEIKNLNMLNIAFQKAQGNFSVSPKAIELTKAKLWPQNGVIDLAGNYDPKAKTYRFNLQGNQLRAEDFLKDSVSGPAEFKGTFSGSVAKAENKEKKKTKPHFARGLSGNFTLKMADGSIQKVGEMEKLLTVLNLFSKKEKKKDRLEFNKLGGDFKIRKGLLATENLALKGQQLNLEVKGRTDLPSGIVNAKIKAVPLKLINDMASALPMLDKWLNDPKHSKSLETHFNVTGSLEKPKFKLQR